MYTNKVFAGMVELADTYASGAYVARLAGSSPVARTISSTYNGLELWVLDYFMYEAGF